MRIIHWDPLLVDDYVMRGNRVINQIAAQPNQTIWHDARWQFATKQDLDLFTAIVCKSYEILDDRMAQHFNGIDITIPGFTFTDIAFDVQLHPTESSGTDTFTAQAFSGAHISDGISTGSDAPDTDKQFSLTAVGGVFDEVNLLSADGFDEIKHIEISGLARVVGSAVPEPSTWAMMGLGFGLMGLLGYRKTRSALA